MDEKALFTETELMILHSNLVKLTMLDNNLSNDDMLSVGRMIEKIETLFPNCKAGIMTLTLKMNSGRTWRLEVKHGKQEKSSNCYCKVSGL